VPVTPVQYLAVRIQDAAPSGPNASWWHQYAAQIEAYLDAVEREGIEAVAIRAGYCENCGSTGLVLIGDVERPCRSCAPRPDFMDIYKERVEG